MSHEELERAKELFAQIILEHVNGERCVTTLTIGKFEDRLRILEVSEQCSI
jgi:hypothetical protein